MDGAAGFTSLDNSVGRTIATPLFTSYAVSSFNAWVWDTRLSGGYDFSTADSLTSSLGLRLTDQFEKGNWRFLPQAQLEVLHQFKDHAVSLDASFIDYPEATFRVSSAAPAGNEAVASMGMTVEYGQDLSLYLLASATLADNRDSRLLAGGLAWSFSVPGRLVEKSFSSRKSISSAYPSGRRVLLCPIER